jgi:hypothetical protein
MSTIIDSINYTGFADIKITYTNDVLKIESDSLIKCTIFNNNLKISAYSSVMCCCFCWICCIFPTFENEENYKSSWEFNVGLNIADINHIGSGLLNIINSNYNKSSLTVMLTGSGNIEIDNCNVNFIKCKLIGSGDIQFKQSFVKEFDGILTGSGDIYTPIIMEKCKCTLKGHGDIVCNIKNSAIITKKRTGSGKIHLCYVD